MPDLTNVQFARRHFFKAIGLGAAAVVAKATVLNSAQASAGAYPPGYCETHTCDLPVSCSRCRRHLFPQRDQNSHAAGPARA